MTRLEMVEEGSTKIVSVSFADEAGTALIPTGITWSLYNELGSIVNSRSAIVVSPASTILIVLTPSDLQYTQVQKSVYLKVKATYSSTYGTGLSIVDTFEIPIEKVVGE